MTVPSDPSRSDSPSEPRDAGPSQLSGGGDTQSTEKSSGAEVQQLNCRPVTAGWQLVFDWVVILIWLGLTDFLVFRHSTFFSWAVLITLAVVLLPLAKRSLGKRVALTGIGVLLLAVAVKLYWCGSLLQILVGLGLMLAYAMALSGSPPFLPELLAFFAWCVGGAMLRLGSYRLGKIQQATGKVQPLVQLQFVLPVIAIAIFGTLFVLANPDLASSLVGRIQDTWAGIQLWASQFSFPEVVFWFLSGCTILGLLYPAHQWLLPERRPQELEGDSVESGLYAAYRNTLIVLSLLFTVYLVFEFSTLWFREFPDDFYYAGYAHQGAFWLTLALALATVVLSTIFQGAMLRDPRLMTLKRLSFVWSSLNFLLAVSVYNRLSIYVGFNGLTRMRIVGFLGISCVVIGFFLVVWKLSHDKGFVWLVHRQLWVPVLGIVVYAILPVDWIAHRFNVAQVQSGRDAASVQIAAQKCEADGILPVFELIDHPTIEIRNGVRALLALWAEELEVDALQGIATESRTDSIRRRRATSDRAPVWESEYGHSSPWIGFRRRETRVGGSLEKSNLDFQLAEDQLRMKLQEVNSDWIGFAESADERDEALNTFFRYTYQWY